MNKNNGKLDITEIKHDEQELSLVKVELAHKTEKENKQLWKTNIQHSSWDMTIDQYL